MHHYLKMTFFLVCISICSKITYADPWLTGPLLAPSGHNVPRGHTNVELYGLDVLTNGQYNNKGKLSSIPLFKSLVFNPLLSHGFTDWLDFQIVVPYVYNSTQRIHYSRLTDTSLGAGIQLVEQRKSTWLPDIRFFLQETFPTGKYDFLNPAFLGTDATGLGSYRTLLSLNFQYLKEVYDAHYLRTRLILSSLISSSVYVNGFNSFGGTINTRGRVNPGAEESVDLAFEYTLTQNWVAVMEGYWSAGQSTRFNGILDIVSDNSPTASLAGKYVEWALAPAIEYNFTEKLGVIGGVWFPVAGRNTSNYITYVLAINAFW